LGVVVVEGRKGFGFIGDGSVVAGWNTVRASAVSEIATGGAKLI
jgi:hypothetical protein